MPFNFMYGNSKGRHGIAESKAGFFQGAQYTVPTIFTIASQFHPTVSHWSPRTRDNFRSLNTTVYPEQTVAGQLKIKPVQFISGSH